MIPAKGVPRWFAVPPDPSPGDPMSALRLPAPEPCAHCGYRVRHVLLGHEEPVRHPPEIARLMRVPLEDRLARRAS